MIICILCTSGRGTGGLLYNHPTNWFSEEPEPPEECPQCGSSLGLFTLTHDQPAAVAVAAETLLAQREEIERLRAENERLTAERAALLAPAGEIDIAPLLEPGDPCCHCGTPKSGHAREDHGFVESVPLEIELAHEVVRLRAAQRDTFKDGQIAALEKTTPIVNDIAAQRDSAERRAQALAARLAALEPVLTAAAQIMGVQAVAPTTPEEGGDYAAKLWGRVNANTALSAEAGNKPERSS